MLAIARAGAAAGCKEALFTLGDKPELRYAVARQALDALGFASTLEYLEHCRARGVRADRPAAAPESRASWTPQDLARLRPVSVSMGLMLESAQRAAVRSAAARTSAHPTSCRHGAWRRSPPPARAPCRSPPACSSASARRAASASSHCWRCATLHARYGHLQEIIIQNFRAKPGTRMAQAPEPTLEEQLWTHRGHAPDLRRRHVDPGAARICSPTRSPPWCAPASTTGAACRPSRPTT